MTTLQAGVSWAQRKDCLYLTVNIPEAKNIKEEFTNSPGKFKVSCEKGDTKYEVDLELYGDIKKEESEWKNTGRNIQFKLQKSENGFWPRLSKTGEKLKYLSVDWDKWVDEDEEDEDTFDWEGGNKLPGLDEFQGPPGGDDSDDEEEEGIPGADLKDLDEPVEEKKE